jgi:hypothetical protein
MDLFSNQIWEGIEASDLAARVRESIWVYPFLETTHVIGLALLFGAIAMFDLRVLGLNKELPVAQLWQHVKPWVWTGFVMGMVSGTLLFIGGAADFAVNPALQLKLALILLAGINAAAFELRIRPTLAGWDHHASAPPAARVSACLSLTLWLAIMIAGRMIAYIK